MSVSRRDYFAAHAPETPQAWFRPVLSREWSKKPETPSGFHPDTRWALDNWLKDPCWDIDPHNDRHVAPRDAAAVAAFVEDMKAHWAINDALRAEEEAERLLQWPFAWADAVLARAEGK